ncbi:MAG: hypothetical protein AB8E15_13455, partial [Bdellovibrionales bacterium]
LDKVDSKVKRIALRSVKGKSKKEKYLNLKAIGDELAGKNTNLYDLPQVLAKTGKVADRFKLSTYIGLASCAGSNMKLADDNYAYNVHYGKGNVDKDDRTGRSFGASRIFQATDSSYTHYLKTLEKYIKNSPENSEDFIKTIMEIITNSEPRNYEEVTDLGDAVLTDFVAIWTAEQTRNIMDGVVKPHWDAALLQVTLLSSFHAGQKNITMFYKDPLTNEAFFTDRAFSLAWPKKNRANESCDVDLESRKIRDASLTDYIGVHYMTFKHCGRSGVNMSRKEWRKLGLSITNWLKGDPKGSVKLNSLVKSIEKYKKVSQKRLDIYRELAKLLISDKRPSKLSNWHVLSRQTADLLNYIRENAETITEQIRKDNPKQLN